ncbi:phage N-6-adenine-methyltransferase [Rodentibacter trehalosifermentans]|uniref:Phage N-6-adenine-methyltransferase n=1 Tax=Rodentibacter trehalosifermentans TaxID=1908263 RepID=A0A1V3J666_9PAST|nr:phage N-6-adenine-methyltransferase [Rodentibacter trehalosifermentans]OOF50728.1 phage N-6-adenine-methyltransferase [Rodentibacter trehalosifermentans]
MTEFNKDHYRTARYVFNWLNLRFRFNVDGCANSRNALCSYFVTEAMDFLEFNCYTVNSRIFVNPPYSDPMPFVKRAAELMAQGHLVVMLLPADKSTKWYKVIQENATEVIDIIGGRINFLHPVTGQEVKGNNKGSMMAVFDPFMQGFVTRQVELGFVKKVGGYGA